MQAIDKERATAKTHSGGGPGRETATRAVFFTPRRQFERAGSEQFILTYEFRRNQ
jgi:hypothetical protein